MSRSALDRIQDIVEAIEAIRQFDAVGRGEAVVFDAVRMRLLEIGEAVNGLPPSLHALEPSVPWKQIVGMRNWMAHRSRVRVFGSVATGQDLPASDVDLLFAMGTPLSLMQLGRLEEQIADLLDARVDLVPESALRTDLRERVYAEAVLL